MRTDLRLAFHPIIGATSVIKLSLLACDWRHTQVGSPENSVYIKLSAHAQRRRLADIGEMLHSLKY